ncbi:hypothetical protein SDC9_35331 [bioreactor metagenome]|uniref:Uncharacterized protein n=1 Tax=bioreactor metagenome TaxID=1076179 RepID=A0A644VDK7_9ZZZZ|nr:hypothetical protein [Methanocorpusculum sp.]
MQSPSQKNVNNEAWNLAREIDKAFEEKREPNVELILAQANSLLPNIDIYSQAHLHYILGTMYGDLTPEIPKEREQNTEQELFHFRKCIDYPSPPTEKIDDSEKLNHLVEYISEDELHKRILSMLHLTREAILTLAMAVQKEEKERDQYRKEKKAQIVLQKYEDRWKL